MNNKSILIAAATVILASGYLISTMVPPSQHGPMNIEAFGRLPCVADGREKPYDTFARHLMMMISDRQIYYDNAGKKQQAVTWLLDIITGASDEKPVAEGIPAEPRAFKARVFRIDNPDLLSFLDLEERTDSKTKFRYAYSEFANKEDALREQIIKMESIEPAQRSLFQKKVGELWTQMQRFYAVALWHVPLSAAPLKSDEKWSTLFDTLAMRVNFDPQKPSTKQTLARVITVNKEAVMQKMSEDESPAVQSLTKVLLAYHRGDAVAFNSEVARFQSQLEMAMPKTTSNAENEVLFNRIEPFYRCMILYVVAMILVLIGLLGNAKTLNRAALWLGMLTLLVHTTALIGRMVLQGRPPVTNLYSSAIFIGWGAVVLALLLEWVYRNGIGTMMASIVGFLTLLVAHNLAADGKDTMEMMQAVLDTNFWLATHVTTVTLGYTATFVAGFLAITYILLGLLTSKLDAALSKQLGTMIYGTICFAVLLSFTGTVLGGIWADQSWGRFWGWDPKENGALMIVIWCALILHARWGGMVKQRGIAVLAVFGNVITAWSWFGVNMLGAGLHSYGFMESAMWWLVAFAGSQLLVIGLGLLPLNLWRSFRDVRPKPQVQKRADPIPT